jgi:hypothetical protein
MDRQADRVLGRAPDPGIEGLGRPARASARWLTTCSGGPRYVSSRPHGSMAPSGVLGGVSADQLGLSTVTRRSANRHPAFVRTI